MAIAFMANSQHMYYRTDILEKSGVDGIPATYDEVISAALVEEPTPTSKKIKGQKNQTN